MEECIKTIPINLGSRYVYEHRGIPGSKAYNRHPPGEVKLVEIAGRSSDERYYVQYVSGGRRWAVTVHELTPIKGEDYGMTLRTVTCN